METSIKHMLLLMTTIVVATFEVLAQGNDSSIRFLSEEELNKVDLASRRYVLLLTDWEKKSGLKFRVKANSTMFDMAKFKQPSQIVIGLSQTNIKFTETIRILAIDFGLTEKEIAVNLNNCTLGPGCLPDPVCPKSDKYRTIDGSCNSPVKQLRNLGRSATGYRRLLKPAYDDGFSSPRKYGVTGLALPNPRSISMRVFSNKSIPLINTTVLLMQFGQLINHDMEFTSQFTFSNGEGFMCCGDNNTPLSPVPSSLVHCLPIPVPAGDPQLNNSKEGCMNFVRSSTGPNRLSCYLPFVDHAEQFNQNSHWLDASIVYGSNNDTMNNLREPLNGLLKTLIDSSGRQLLPLLKCSKMQACLFNAGDSRVNEQPQLTVMHTIWHREHNRIAIVLAKLNPSWDSETVFQETRRIVIAELQHITYNEFLPNLLGVTGMDMNSDLRPLPGNGTISLYKKLISGPVSNEFAAAAFRMGHSLVQGTLQLYDVNGTLIPFRMQDLFNSPANLLIFNTNLLDNAIRGLVSQSSQTVDTQIVDDLRLNLFQTGSGYSGPTSGGILDIVALNIQRGRDHGLPSYNSYRKYCGIPILKGSISSLPTKKTSDPTIPYFDPLVVKNLSSLYKSVDDIDLFVGGIAEISPLPGALIGPTFMCIISENFKQLKFTDRYFYESAANPYPFTTDQLIQIKNSSMARILCDNNDGTVVTMQPNAFVRTSGTNAKVNCSDMQNIPIVNLDFWKV